METDCYQKSYEFAGEFSRWLVVRNEMVKEIVDAKNADELPPNVTIRYIMCQNHLLTLLVIQHYLRINQ